MTWIRRDTEVLFRHAVFRLERRYLERPGASRQAVVIEAPAWVNVVPLTADERVLMVRQWRFGIEAPTLEIPGGMVDPGERPREAAARELLEETGHRAGSLERLGELHPNPAILSNRVTTWLATALEPVHPEGPRGDGEEEITLEAVPLAEVPRRIAAGEITHALVVAGFHLLAIHRGRL